MKFFLLTLMTLLFIGCAFSKEDGLETNKNLLRQNAAIDTTYGPLEGTYDGNLIGSTSTSRLPQKVTLRIKITNESTTNPDGSPAVKRVPTAFFTRTSPVIDNYAMTVRAYTPETGDLSLISKDRRSAGDPSVPSDSLGFNDISSVELKVIGQRMTGEVYSVTGLIGTIDISLSSRQTDAPSDNSNEDIRNSYIALYKKVEGRYVGKIEKPNTKSRPVAIDLRIVNASIPFLRGLYSPLDAVGAGLDLTMKVDYNPNLSPPRITLGSANDVPGSTYIIDINGTLDGDTIVADINSVHRGYLGVLTVKKEKPKK